MKRYAASDDGEIVLLHVQSNPSRRKADLHQAHGSSSCFYIDFVVHFFLNLQTCRFFVPHRRFLHLHGSQVILTKALGGCSLFVLGLTHHEQGENNAGSGN